MSKIKPAIEIKGLSKAYMIGHEKEAMAGTMTFRDSLTNMVRKPIELITGHQLKKEKFWALKDVNLKIERGDVVGIIGRNGSGKSTLLKVLSRIVEPTKGEVIMRGRVASLLEVGTGFHPELTGRENVYFNGAILGMTRKEIQSKFDEIVAFSEVEKFLDTPVKFYSSGMYVRLAFAVAAHLDPDILIVDEVLAVGDAAFQKKCLGKMRDVAGQGRTVLFVSHSMDSVRKLCTKGIFIKDGKIESTGNINTVIQDYMSFNGENRSIWTTKEYNLDKNEYLEISKASLSFKNHLVKGSVRNNQEITVKVTGKIYKQSASLNIGLAVYDIDGNIIFWTFTTDMANDEKDKSMPTGSFEAQTVFPTNILNEGDYIIEILASLHNQRWLLEPGGNVPTLSFSIKGGLSNSPYWQDKRPGIIAPVLDWNISK
ncbi:ATP-binding cassette domain-containing protein [bacterium]|nr:MAG: ATP-binding cassette domain-containing protein [bacterium]